MAEARWLVATGENVSCEANVKITCKCAYDSGSILTRVTTKTRRLSKPLWPTNGCCESEAMLKAVPAFILRGIPQVCVQTACPGPVQKPSSHGLGRLKHSEIVFQTNKSFACGIGPAQCSGQSSEQPKYFKARETYTASGSDIFKIQNRSKIAGIGYLRQFFTFFRVPGPCMLIDS